MEDNKTNAKEVSLTPKQSILKGLYEAAKMVVSSMGPNGRKVGLVPDHISQDGVTISRFAQNMAYDQFERFGAKLLNDAASKTVDEAGDGTTTTCLLTRELVQATEDCKPDIVPKLKRLAESIVVSINEMAIDPNFDQLKKMSVVAARTRPEVGEMIAKLIWEVGKDAHIQSFPGPKTETEIKKGYEMNSGFLVHTFMNPQPSPNVDASPFHVRLIDPLVLLVEEKIEAGPMMQNLFKKWQMKDMARPLVLIASDVSGTALAVSVANFKQKGLPLFLVKAPAAGVERIDVMEDLHAGVGGVLIGKITGTKFKNFDGNFGEAETVTIQNGKTHFLFKKKFEERIAQRAEKVIDEERKSKLTKGVGVIHIGGNSEIEHKELSEVVEDCVLSSQASLKHGVLPGGGYVFEQFLINAKKGRKEEVIMRQAFRSVFKTLTKGIKVPEGEGVFNVITKKWEDPENTNIFDSAAAVTNSITNSVSLACEILTMNYAIKSINR